MSDDRSGDIDQAHRLIISAIRPVLEQYGFGLAGGNALRVHGLSSRPTRDVNMFTSQDGAITRVVPKVEAALRAAGFGVQLAGAHMRKVEFLPDVANYDARWIVTVGERRVLLEVALRDTLNPPTVIGDIGPVLGVDDVLASKTLALVDRADARDFADVFEAMRRGWSPERLIALAWRLNPADYDAEHFTEVRRNLAELDDFEFTKYGLSLQQVKELRELFRQWPAREE